MPHTTMTRRVRCHRSLRRAVLPLAVIAGLAGPWAQQSPPPRPPAGAPTVLLITGARILDPAAGRYLPAAAVLVEGGRIKSVTRDEPSGLPAGTVRLAPANATIVPGLIDLSAAIAPTADLNTDYFAALGLAHGVTGYRALNLRTTWAVGQKRRIDAGLIESPRLWVGGRGIDAGARRDLWLFDAPDAPLAAAEASRQAAANVDWVAGYENLTADRYRALMTAVTGSPVRVAAVPGATSMSDLAAIGVHSIETLAWPLTARPSGATDPAAADGAWIDAPARDLAALAQRLARAKVTLDPQVARLRGRAFPEDFAKEPSLTWLPDARRATLTAAAAAAKPGETERAKRVWAVQTAFLSRFLKAGGRLVTGTGFDLAGYPLTGVGVHAELTALVQGGLTPAEAIRAATTHAAALVGSEQTLGQIAAGRDADFVIVQGDPLAAIGDLLSITHVVRRGEVLDPAEVRARIKADTGGVRPGVPRVP